MCSPRPSIYKQGSDAIDDIMGDVFGVSISKALDPLDPGDFEKISISLARKLEGIALPEQAAALKVAIDTVDVDWSSLTPQGVTKILKQANKTLMSPAPKIIKKFKARFKVDAKGIVTTSKKSAIAQYSLNIGQAFNSTDKRIVEHVVTSQANFITNQYGKTGDKFSEKARGIVSRGTERGLDKRFITEQLQREMRVFGRTPFYWETIAATFANRARTWTQLHSFGEAGIEFYIWDSVLDENTTDTCRFLHEKRFPVKDAVKLFDRVEKEAKSGDPEAIKETQPWVRTGVNENGESWLIAGRGEDRFPVARIKESAVGSKDKTGQYSSAMSDSKLLGNGISMPPIHGLCRSTVLADV